MSDKEAKTTEKRLINTSNNIKIDRKRRITLLSVKILVEVTGLEPAASCSQSKRATNCATPRYD